MFIYGTFERDRVSIDVPIGTTVGEVKKKIQVKLGVFFETFNSQDKKTVVLSYAGSKLNDEWIFTDLGILPGSTIKLVVKEDIHPVLFVYCTHNQETIDIRDDLAIGQMPVQELRSIVAQKTGLPISIFRLVAPTGREMYDCQLLEEYSIDIGDTVRMENWDGWNEFINMSIMGFTPQVLAQLDADEIMSRFQMKVALFISAHFGHADLARWLQKQGSRSDEPVGEHPTRQWCSSQSHIDCRKCPVHVATENGHLGVLRLFVNNDITCLMAKDGFGLTALNISLRKKKKNCASYILTQQWTRIPVGKQSLNLQTIKKVRDWCDKAKETVFMKYGPAKSSLKRRHFHSGPLVGHGVVLDGFSPSPMTGKPKAQMKDRKRNLKSISEESADDNDPEAYFKRLGTMQTLNMKVRKTTKWGKVLEKTLSGPNLMMGLEKSSQAGSKDDKSLSHSSRSTVISLSPTHSRTTSFSNPDDRDDVRSVRKLPPILESKSRVNKKLTKLNKISKDLPDESSEKTSVNFDIKDKTYIQTGASKSNKANIPNLSLLHDKLKTLASNLPDNTSISESDKLPEKPQTSQSDRKSGRSSRMSSVMLLTKAKSSEGTIPLPIISNELGVRPFFYHNGMREEDILQPAMDLLSAYQGLTPRDRAIRSLSIANTFKGKTWLRQVSMAMNLTSKSMHRPVPRSKVHKRRHETSSY